MGSRGCDGYGKEWEKGDPVCLDCPDEYSCRDRTLKRKRLILEKRKNKASGGSDTVGGGSNRGVYSYPTNTKYLLPEDGESPVARIGKNMLAGGLSAMGGEIYAFFQEWRWPFQPAPAEAPKADEEPKPKEKEKPTQQSKPKPKPKPRQKPAKRIVVNDFDDDDELDIDLDDL